MFLLQKSKGEMTYLHTVCDQSYTSSKSGFSAFSHTNGNKTSVLVSNIHKYLANISGLFSVLC